MSSKPVGELSISIAEFKWIISTKEFDCKKKGKTEKVINSPTFFVSNSIQKMYLQIDQIFEVSPYDEDYVSEDSMGLFLMNDNNYNVTLDYNFSLLDNYNKKCEKAEFKNCKIKPKGGMGPRHFLSREWLFARDSKFIKDDKITIVFELYKESVDNGKKNQTNLWKINEKLFNNQTYSDVTVKCNGQEFQLHKCILANRSTVFKSMFETDMVEKEKNIVEINDISYKVLHQFFRYLYTNTVDDFKEVAKDLLVVADKYLVSELKDECKETLCDLINIENAMEYLKIAEIYDVQKLKREVIKFIALNLDNFENSKKIDFLSKDKLMEMIDYRIRLLQV